MRFVVFFLGLLSCTLTGILGAVLFFEGQVVATARDILGDSFKYVEILRSPENLSHTMGFFLLIAAGMGLIGAFLTLFRCGWQGTALMFVPIIGPGVLNPLSLAVSGLQIVPAVCSLFVGPLPINPPESLDVQDED